MLHVWQASTQGNLRVWQPEQKAWQIVPTWQNLSELFTQRSVCLYIPTQAILSLTSELSLSQLKQLGDTGKQYLFEDISLTPVEQLQVKTLQAKTLNDKSQDLTYLYAAANSDIEAWVERAKLAGFEILAVLPDFVLLPIPDLSQGVLQGTKANIYLDNETALVRQSENYGIAISYLPLLLQSIPNIEELGILEPVEDNNSITDDVFTNSLSKTNNLNQQQDLNDLLNNQGIISYNLSTIPTPIVAPLRHPLNFIVKQHQSKLSGYLKVAIITGLCAGLVQLSADALQVYQYTQATQAVKSNTNEQFAHWFGGESLNERVDVPLQVQPYLIANTSSQTPQLDVLSRISPLIKQANVTAESLNWNDQSVTLTLSSEQRSNLDGLVGAMSQQGLKANLGRIEPKENGSVMGEVNIELTHTTDNDTVNVS